jgi:hypothetical protein
MAKEIIYVDKLSTVPRAEGAPQWYTRGDQVYFQGVDEDGELIPDHEEHYKWESGGHEAAMRTANSLQLGANKKVSKTKKKKR